MMIGRRSTRDIAVAAEAGLASRMAADAEHHQRIEGALTRQDEERRAFHSENQSEFHRVHGRIDAVETHLNALPWKLIAGMGAMLTMTTAVIGWLVVRAAPWAGH